MQLVNGILYYFQSTLHVAIAGVVLPRGCQTSVSMFRTVRLVEAASLRVNVIPRFMVVSSVIVAPLLEC
jgi:hypothetical protein